MGKVYKDSIEALRQAVERKHSKAKYKEKVFVRFSEGKLAWEGDVFVFELIHNSKQAASTKEEIANWKLDLPTAESVKAAEERGLKIRNAFQTANALKAEPLRKAKLAYAWSSAVKGSHKREFHVVLHKGQVKSPTDAVKAALLTP